MCGKNDHTNTKCIIILFLRLPLLLLLLLIIMMLFLLTTNVLLLLRLSNNVLKIMISTDTYTKVNNAYIKLGLLMGIILLQLLKLIFL